MKIVFASTNAGKIKEVKSILNHPDLEIISLDQLGIEYNEVDETGSTFEENAKLKAEYFSQLTNLPALADDSGLEVDALYGGPGVKSSRWHPGSDDDRNAALLNKLSGENIRTARFVTVAYYINPSNGSSQSFRGEVAGSISAAPSGAEGFGYDPIFIPDGYDKTFAELGLDIKNQLSHRARAYKQAEKFIEEELKNEQPE